MLREKEIAHRNNVLARIGSAEQDRIRISPNTNITINGYMCDTIPYHPVCGILAPTVNSKIPNNLDIEPILVTYDTKARDTVPVRISNITTNTVTVNPHTLLCEI